MARITGKSRAELPSPSEPICLPLNPVECGLFVNRYAFGLPVWNRQVQICNTTPPLVWLHTSLALWLVVGYTVRLPDTLGRPARRGMPRGRHADVATAGR
jgi:hypothetical protein